MRHPAKLILSLTFWGILAFVIWQVPPPPSLISANPVQILIFLLPLFLALSFSVDIFFKNAPLSASIALGLILLLILNSLNSLNLATIALTLIATFLLVSYFRKAKARSLTKLPKIPKLTKLRKQNVSL